MRYGDLDSQQYMEEIKSGNRAAFQHLFEQYYRRLCNYTLNYTMNYNRAEDIVQQVFISLWNNRMEIVITTSLKSYLYKSCYYKYIDIYRKRKRIDEKLEGYRYHKLMELETERAGSSKEQDRKLKILRQALEGLPPRCREIFMLSKYEGLQYQEIADHLGISKKTVENQIGKAYSYLREECKLKSVLIIITALKTPDLTADHREFEAYSLRWQEL